MSVGNRVYGIDVNTFPSNIAVLVRTNISAYRRRSRASSCDLEAILFCEDVEVWFDLRWDLSVKMSKHHLTSDTIISYRGDNQPQLTGYAYRNQRNKRWGSTAAVYNKSTAVWYTYGYACAVLVEMKNNPTTTTVEYQNTEHGWSYLRHTTTVFCVEMRRY